MLLRVAVATRTRQSCSLRTSRIPASDARRFLQDPARCSLLGSVPGQGAAFGRAPPGMIHRGARGRARAVLSASVAPRRSLLTIAREAGAPQLTRDRESTNRRIAPRGSRATPTTFPRAARSCSAAPAWRPPRASRRLRLQERAGRQAQQPPLSKQRKPHHEHDHDQGRHADLLQRLGHRAAGRLQPRLAAHRGRLRGPDVLPRLSAAIAASPTIAAATAGRASPGTATTWTPMPTTSRRSSRRSTSRTRSTSVTRPAAARWPATSAATAPSASRKRC